MEIARNADLQERLRRIAVLIPCWQPDQRLIELVESLARFSFQAIVVVNDGSEAEYDAIFERVRAIPSAVVLRHERNRGTGRAVKTAMQYALNSLPKAAGVVTADADGQHAVSDIVHVAEAIAADGTAPVLGSRRFGPGVPLRSRFGNILTKYVFLALSGHRFADTQCGLRGIPLRWVPAMLAVKGDRYEFVMSSLAEMCRLGIPPRQMPIETIYFRRNRSSHFKPVRDSIRIYFNLFRHYAGMRIKRAPRGGAGCMSA
jgi:glycosyltransferase involved in cell wall biosynthesis